jgi:GNAT superfamily N-acetyltransferase
MESIERKALTVEALASLDAASAAMLESLVVDSGWNQTHDYWALFAQQGVVQVVRDESGRIVASGAVLPLEPGAAWISMILVAPALRSQGLGRKVFEQCLRTVQASGRVAMLDATPAGEKLYAQFNFAPQWQLSRWQRQANSPSKQSAPPPPPPSTQIDALAALDEMALGLNRSKMLGQFSARRGACLVRHSQACSLVRAGRFARHIGPLLAPDEASAVQLLREVADSDASALLIDVPDERPLMHQQLAASGFERIRSFTRMSLGEPVPHGRLPFIHAIAGPEYG